ncbi:hypothetical protein OF83DRAFT_1165305 [Amylostereum chailletii]|nr:hypothetical protein OF83DRAFT_1165305 [Amylostereum chailletii]
MYPIPLTLQDLVLFGLSFLVCAIAFKIFQSRSAPAIDTTSEKGLDELAKPDIEGVKSNRALGEWSPEDFTYPAVTPSTEKLSDMLTRIYRPFKAGTYHVTMGMRNMGWDNWIEVDNQLLKYHRIRSERIASRGEKLIQVVPDRPIVRGGAEAAYELMHELAEFLSRRYPSIYTVTRDASKGGWYRLGKIKTITINPVDVTYDLEKDEPIRVAASLIQDDFAIMIEGKDGQYYLQAGAIIIPGFWRLRDKIGMPLDELHMSSDVPYYQEKLRPSLNRFFSNIKLGGPVVRDNWFLQVLGDDTDPTDPEELAWNQSVFGSEDEFQHGPSSYMRERGDPAASQTALDALQRKAIDEKPPPPIEFAPHRIQLRSEHQSLRRLPRTGAVIFTIRPYVTPIKTLTQEPGVPGRLASAIRGVDASAPDMNNWKLPVPGMREALLDYLDSCHEAQMPS